MSRIDPTLTIERMSDRLRREHLKHPVAGALTLAARGHLRMVSTDFAEHIAVSRDVLRSCEEGSVAFGDLPSEIGRVAAQLGADLLFLADLARADYRPESHRAANP